MNDGKQNSGKDFTFPGKKSTKKKFILAIFNILIAISETSHTAKFNYFGSGQMSNN